jgi:hypothetical protein
LDLHPSEFAEIAKVSVATECLLGDASDVQLAEQRRSLCEQAGATTESLTPEAAAALLDTASFDWLLRAARILRAHRAKFPLWLLPSTEQPLVALALFKDDHFLEELASCEGWWNGRTPEERERLLKSRPAEGPTLVARLEAALADSSERNAGVERLRAIESALSERARAKIGAELAADPVCLATLQIAEALVGRVQTLRETVNPVVIEEVLCLIADLGPDGADAIADLEALVEDLPLLAKHTPSLQALRSARARPARTGSAEPPLAVVSDRSGATLQHPLSTRSPHAATLVWREVAGKPSGYGEVAVPLRLKLDAPSEAPLPITIKFSGPQFEGRPAEWVREYQIVECTMPAGREYWEFEVRLPALKKDLIGGPITVSYELNGAVRAEGLKTLEWKNLRTALPQFPSLFPTVVSPAVMTKGPLGIEKKFKDVLAVVEKGEESFLVTGPRRCGKSTLIDVITKSITEGRGVAVVPPVTASGLRLDAVWRMLGDLVATHFKRPVIMELESGLVPKPDVFDAVREEALSRGIRSIYLVIDEAQALFRDLDEGRRLDVSERLKVLLEGAWGRRTDRLAAIRVGFVGQAHLRRLISNNLLGALPRTFPADPIQEDDLVEVLRAATKGEEPFECSKDARRRLAELSGNLYILNQLMGEVESRCRRFSRVWFLEEDVECALQKLLERGRQPMDTVWRYVRDALGRSERMDPWEPSEAYPVALAWARALNEKVPEAELEARVVGLLAQWAQNTSILPDNVRDQIIYLRAENVLSGNRFALPMLEKLLAVRAEAVDPFLEDAERQALQHLGLPAVGLPPKVLDGLEVVGGQGRVYQGKEDDQSVAVRCVRLDTTSAHSRFIHEIRLLSELRDYSHPDFDDAYRHLPRMKRAGLNRTDSKEGVVVYGWIDGDPLSRETLSELGVVTVGMRLGPVLALLEHKKIVHRDVKPENVMIRAGASEPDPVLIDFGLARAVEDLQGSDSIKGGFIIPPEIHKDGVAAWTSRGDVYCLGVTLQMAARKGACDKVVEDLLDRMTDGDNARRPSARDVMDSFAKLREVRRVESRKNAILEEGKRLSENLPKELQSLAASAMGDALACRLGFFPREVRCAKASFFLEECFQLLVRLRYPALYEAFEGDRKTLLNAANDVLTGKEAPALRAFRCGQATAVGKMRNGAAHRAKFETQVSAAYVALGIRRPEKDKREESAVLSSAVLHIASLLDEAFGRPNAAWPIREFSRWGLELAPG